MFAPALRAAYEKIDEYYKKNYGVPCIHHVNEYNLAHTLLSVGPSLTISSS